MRSQEQKDGVQCTVQLWDSGHQVEFLFFNFVGLWQIWAQKEQQLTKNGFHTQVAREVHACSGEMVVAKPNLWWPHLMAEQPGHMMMVGI